MFSFSFKAILFPTMMRQSPFITTNDMTNDKVGLRSANGNMTAFYDPRKIWELTETVMLVNLK